MHPGARPAADNGAEYRRIPCGAPCDDSATARDEQTGHGFRTMASTLLNELGFAPDVIELQLAHAERNKDEQTGHGFRTMASTLLNEWASHRM